LIYSHEDAGIALKENVSDDARRFARISLTPLSKCLADQQGRLAGCDLSTATVDAPSAPVDSHDAGTAVVLGRRGDGPASVNREAMRTTSMMGSSGDKNDRRCRVVGVRWKPAILSATTSGIETWWRNHDFIQETGWIMCGFGIDGGHVVGIFESG
jgi:hypothetical protein